MNTNILIQIYWLYAFLSALFFWRFGKWLLLFPLLSFVLGCFLYMQTDLISLYAQGTFVTALLSLALIFLKYSFPKSSTEDTRLK